MDSIEQWATQTEFTVQRFSIERAIRALIREGQLIEALALIRATYKEEDGGQATLVNARIILDAIKESL